MADSRERWALILGASSGMGEATARALAAAGYNICGIHLDFRAGLAHVEEIKTDWLVQRQKREHRRDRARRQRLLREDR